jgi:hypothetical protein
MEGRNMRRTLVIAAVLAGLVAPARASDGVELSIRSKSMAAAASVPAPNPSSEAPFRAGGARDPLPELLLREEQERRGYKASCDTATTSLCYDSTDRKIVYRGVRKYMPQIDGLRAESVSVRHDRIILKYSF